MLTPEIVKKKHSNWKNLNSRKLGRRNIAIGKT
jgi:hypothetical protein